MTRILPANTATGRLVTLDRIVSLEPGQQAVAVRNVPNTLAIFDSHFPRFPVLPGVLILGSLGELAATLLQESVGGVWRLAGADAVRYRHFVQPGDELELTLELKETSEDTAVCTATARVDGRPVTTVRRLHLERRGAEVPA
jgi:3-hydroxyacyl-[acyl-carrier-protein] dehydratase